MRKKLNRSSSQFDLTLIEQAYEALVNEHRKIVQNYEKQIENYEKIMQTQKQLIDYQDRLIANHQRMFELLRPQFSETREAVDQVDSPLG